MNFTEPSNVTRDVMIMHSSESGGDVFSQARIHIQGRNMTGLQNVFECLSTPNATDVQGNTLLHVACQNGNKKAAKFLLKNNCEINAQNHSMQTPLHYCYGYRYTELAHYLESKGANTSLLNVHGFTPTQ